MSAPVMRTPSTVDLAQIREPLAYSLQHVNGVRTQRDGSSLTPKKHGSLSAFRVLRISELQVTTKVDTVRGEKPAKCKPGDVVVKVDPPYFRPTEVETLLGDPSKAKRGWEPTTPFSERVREMVASEYSAAKGDNLVKLAGSQAYDHQE